MIYGYRINYWRFFFVVVVVFLDKNHLFYLCDTGKFILVPNMLLQTWLLLLFCEAVIYITVKCILL